MPSTWLTEPSLVPSSRSQAQWQLQLHHDHHVAKVGPTIGGQLLLSATVTRKASGGQPLTTCPRSAALGEDGGAA